MEKDVLPGGKLPGPVAACGHGLVTGLCVGVVVACFRTVHNCSSAKLLHWFGTAGEHWSIIPFWGLVLVLVAALIGRLVAAVPLIPGSGIPQTELTLAGRIVLAPVAWARLLAAKFAGSWLALLGGLSLGREGPCVQMGSAVGAIAGSFARHPETTESPWVIGGAAAGLAAAFGAPVAGILFAFEEMKNRLTPVNILFALTAAFAAQTVAARLFGLGRLFPFAHFTPPPFSQWWALLLLGGLIGLLGVAYNVLLIRFKDAEARRNPLPTGLRTLPALLVAGVLAFTFPQVLGGGDGLIVTLGTAPTPMRLLLLLFVLKMTFSIFSYMGNVPGGLLMPLLCIGALAGHATGGALAAAGLMDPAGADAFIVFGMAGLFAASVRAPLTGIALVLEMSGTVACLPGTALVAFLASLLASRLGCAPVYDSLKARIRLPVANPEADR